MRAWRFHEFGDIKNLILENIDSPEPAEGEALVRVDFAALNPADRFLVQRQYPRPGTPPFSVGRDCCATVMQVHPGSRFKAGDAVILLRSDVGVSRTGTLAEQVCIPEEALAPLPEGWSKEEGAAGPLVMLTAWQALVDRGGLQAGETVLITGASGGVGTAAIPLAKGLGAKVVALSSTESKWPILKELGADIVINSRAEDVEQQVKDALEGGRVDLVVENLGGPYLQKCINMIGLHGRISVVGLLAGLKSEITVGLLIFKCIKIQGLNVATYTEAESQEAWKQIVLTLEKVGQRPMIDKVFPMDQVQEAFAHLAGGPMGKVLVDAQH